MTYEAYTVLKVKPQATIEIIKQNYARLCREHSNNEEKLNSVLQAHEILVDDSRIKEIYDTLQFTGELWKVYENKYSQKAWEEAIETLMRIATEKPDKDEIESLISVLHRAAYEITYPIWQEKEKLKDDYIQHKFGLCYTHIQQWSEAIEAYERLIAQKAEWKPEDSIYWLEFGQVYRYKAESLYNEGTNQSKLYQNARERFIKAIDLDLNNSAPYLYVAVTYLKENNYSEAITWAENAIEADGKLDFDDFEALHFLCIVYASNRDFQKIKEIALKIKPLLFSQEERNCASSSFTKYANECYQKAVEQHGFLEEADFCVQLNLFEISIAFLKAAEEFSPTDKEIEKQRSKIENLVYALNQFQDVKNDPLFPDSYKNLVVLSLSDYIDTSEDTSDSNDKLESFFSSLIIEISALPGTSFTKLTDRLSSRYSEVYNLNKEIFYRFGRELDKHQIKTLTSRTELFSINSYQDFVETIKNTYFQNSDTFKEKVGRATDQLHILLEPIAEKIIEKYENIQSDHTSLFDEANYQSFVEMIRSRASADSASVKKRTHLAAKYLHDRLSPLAEKLVDRYPSSQRFISPFVEKLSEFSEEID